MSGQPTAKLLWRAGEIDSTAEIRISHPWNPNSEVCVRPISQAAGLERDIYAVSDTNLQSISFSDFIKQP